MGWRARLAWLGGTAAAGLGWGLLMARFTDAAAPMLDAGIAGASVAAQILLSLRRVENWVFWIGVDIAAIGLFYSRGLYATTMLYAVFLVMAGVGLAGWARAARAGAK
jgi:nicotinamide mononucleotide transporter